MISGAKAVFESLKREGIDHVFGLPGTTILDLFDALYNDPDIKLIVCRHEQGAAFMADGYTRSSGKPSVCIASRGPGALNMAIAVHNAFMESSPVICLIGQVAQDISQQDAFEEIDLVSVFRPFTKWALEIQKAERIPELVQKAVRTAVSGRPRPVMISIPMDLQQVDIQPTFAKRRNIPKIRPDIKDINKAIEQILKSKRPVIMAGGGVNISGANNELIKFVEFMNIPVIATWLRNDVFPNDHPLYLGAAGFGAPKAVYDFLKKADLLLTIGCRFSEFTTLRYTFPKPDTTIISIDIDAEGMNRVFFPTVSITADAKLALIDLISGVRRTAKKIDIEKKRKNFPKEIRRTKDMLIKLSTVENNSYQGKFIHPGILIQNIQKTLTKDTIVVVDAGSFTAWVGRFFKYSMPGTMIAPAGGSMGFGFPAALGVQIAQPKRKVVAITGDGCFMMVLQELETAVRYKIPVIVVVMNNFAFGNVKEKQLKTYGGRIIGSEYANPDFAKLAQLFGANGERIEKTAEIVPAMKRALSSKMPTVLDVIVDPELTLPPTS